MGLVDLLLLADGRAPVGAYAHSYGLESAVAAGDVHDVPTLSAFTATRVGTAGLVEAAFVAGVRHRSTTADASTDPSPGLAGWLDEGDDELTARQPSPAVRDASRQLGRYLLRLGRRAWPDPRLDALARQPPPGYHQALVLGVVGAVAGTTVLEAATVSLYGLASGLASAGVRLLGLDPVEVHAEQARLSGLLADTAGRAAACAELPFADLPVTGTPLVDIRAQHHAADPAGRLFAS